MFSRLVKQLAEKENVTEKLKAENQMLWVRKMNNIQACAKEIVDTKLIYAQIKKDRNASVARRCSGLLILNT